MELPAMVERTPEGPFPFLAGRGEVGALMRAHDWSSSPLGAPSTWPPPLRAVVSACLNSPMLGAVLWGPDLVLLYNDAYIPALAERHPSALGRPVAEVWGETWREIAAPFLQAMQTGEGFEQTSVELPIVRRGTLETTWWDFTAAPIRGEDGTIVGLLSQGTEITGQVRAGHALRAAAAREAFRAELGDALRGLASPADIMATVANRLGEHLGVDQANYYQIEDGCFVVLNEWRTPESRGVVGRHPLAGFGEGAMRTLQQGALMRLDDTQRAEGAAAFAAFGMAAVLSAPLHRGGQWVGGFHVHQVHPRAWTDAEADLVRETAERAWAAIERASAEARLRDSEARYRTLFEAIDAGFCTIEVIFEDDQPTDYRFVEVNPAFERQTGLAGAAGRTARELVPELEPHWPELFGRVALTGETVRYEDQVGALGRWFDVLAQRVGDPAARRVAVLVSDVTERRRAEEGLRDLNEVLERKVEERTRERDRAWRISQDLQAVLDSKGVFLAVNDAWATVLGWRPDEVVGRSYLDFIHPDDHSASKQALAMAAGATLPAYENRYRHKDGGYRWVSWVAALEESLFYASGRHVTAEKEAAAALDAVQEQLRQSQKMEAVGQLTGGLAHDFNNLLAGISGSLELLQTRVAQGRINDLDRYLVAAQGASKRAAALTHRLLAFTRRQTLDPKPTDVNRLVGGMEELICRTVGPQVAVEIVGAGGLWTTLVDPNQLENALLNLCINARDAMPDGGRLTIETNNKWLDVRAARERDLLPGQYVSLCVSDTGTGMTPEVIRRAFDPFFTTKPIGMGTGLGLSMIYGFVQQSGGQARIYSEPGQGAMVCLYLPRHHGEAASEKADAELAGAPRAGQGETVLVVDDEPTVRMLVTEVLEDLGYTAIEAADGPAGLKVLRSDVRIDLLVTDVGLPGGMNGRQVADAGRAVRPELKVLFITGYAENAVVGNGHLDPGMHVLTKPFAMEALASRIKELIAGKPEASR